MTGDTSKHPYCTACNNEIGFYQIENEYLAHPDNIPKYMECYTWRREKLISDPTRNKSPPQNTLLVGTIFKVCHTACKKCTSIGTSIYDTHCQAKQCNTGYIYVQNNEDICFDSTKEFPLHFSQEI